MNSTRINASLGHLEVGLTGAVPGRHDWSEPAMDRAILEFVALFSGIVLKYGGRIVHGTHPSFTPVILRQARLHGGSRARKPVTLIASALWATEFGTEFRESLSDVAELIVVEKIGGGGPENVETRNRSLTEMRRVLIDRQNTMVAVGGKMHAKDGMVPGVKEEMDLAEKAGIPRFLIAGMGGYAARYAKELTPSALKNGLSDEENQRLFSTTDVAACVNLLFERLARVD